MNPRKNTTFTFLSECSHAYLVFAAAPVVPVVIPLIVDMANGHDPDKDIVVKRANTTDETSL